MVDVFKTSRAFVKFLAEEFPEAAGKEAELLAFSDKNPQLLSKAMAGDADAMATLADGFVKREGIAAVSSATGQRLTGTFLQSVLGRASAGLADEAAEAAAQKYEQLLVAKGYKAKGVPGYDQAKDLDREMAKYERQVRTTSGQGTGQTGQTVAQQAGQPFQPMQGQGTFGGTLAYLWNQGARVFSGAIPDAKAALGLGEYATSATRLKTGAYTALRVAAAALGYEYGAPLVANHYQMDTYSIPNKAAADAATARGQAEFPTIQSPTSWNDVKKGMKPSGPSSAP